MTIEQVIAQPINKTGTRATWLHYKQTKKPRRLVFWAHGQGEGGPLDGSELIELEKLEGFPRFARGKRPWNSTITGAVEYDFDIVAVQVVSLPSPLTSYDHLLEDILGFLILNYGYTDVIIGGISMGNFFVWRLLKKQLGSKFIRGIVAICGSADKKIIPTLEKVPGIAWHGDDDERVGYSGHKSFVDAYNAAGGQVEFITIPGGRHNAWTYAFNIDPTKDRTLKKINEIFASHETGGDTSALEQRIADLTAELNTIKNGIVTVQTNLKNAL